MNHSPLLFALLHPYEYYTVSKLKPGDYIWLYGTYKQSCFPWVFRIHKVDLQILEGELCTCTEVFPPGYRSYRTIAKLKLKRQIEYNRNWLPPLCWENWWVCSEPKVHLRLQENVYLKAYQCRKKLDQVLISDLTDMVLQYGGIVPWKDFEQYSRFRYMNCSMRPLTAEEEGFRR
jgi:hypothetical protein